MQIKDLKPAAGSRKSRKRVGRGTGSGSGTTAGKGTKGQNARSGGPRHPRFEGGQMPIIRRLPKRGFTNIFRKEYTIVNLDTLSKLTFTGEVSAQSLSEIGMARANKPLKVLGRGELSQPLVIKAAKFSKSALEKIEKSGGTAVKV
ncbi:MAG: 50S ribosomal protein L15 [Nitrospinota bacterium]|nr:50S ribosomal protein L15 [Nitrospinota bacterium]